MKKNINEKKTQNDSKKGEIYREKSKVRKDEMTMKSFRIFC